MTPEPTFFVLDGLQGWRQAFASGVRQGHSGGRSVLELAPSATDQGLVTRGQWIREPLDSGIAGCVWHRIELTVTLPAGCAVKVATATSDELSELQPCPPTPIWIPAFVAGGAPPDHRGHLMDSPGFPIQEGLVQSRGGRYLRLRFELTGDHEASPRIEVIRIHFPRLTWLDLLPAVYSADAERRGFLDRFLSTFHTPWSELQDTLDTFYHYLDPKATPDTFLDTLAAWLGQPLEGEWPAWKNRRLLAATPGLLPWRGTAESIHRVGAIYLANITNRSVSEVRPFPIILENQRHHHLLTPPDPSTPPGGVGTSDHLEITTDDAGSETARSDRHRRAPYSFLVVVPAAWIDTIEKRQTLERAIEQEKPAATCFALWLLGGGTRIGVRSTVGVDTLIGAPPPTTASGETAHTFEGRP